MIPRATGFTLLELLLAITLTATFLAAAMASIDLFVAADRTAIRGYELDAEVQRALRLLDEDVQQAVSISDGVRSITIERSDGTFVAWVRPTGDQELHRLTDVSALAVDTRKSTLLLDLVPPEFDARGRLRDTSYRSSAVLQGDHAWSLTSVTSAYDGARIGLQLTITCAAGEARSRRTLTTCSFELVERHSKPPID